MCSSDLKGRLPRVLNASVVRVLILATISLAVFTSAVSGATVRTIDVPSAAMACTVKTSIVLPVDYAEDGLSRFPVVYLLHGAGNDHTTYLQPSILNRVDRGRFLAVIPDGGTDWWMDSPILPKVKRETFIVRELVPYVDAHFRTLPQKEMRAIAGHSMGGQGASRLGMRHTDLFGTVGNIMGGVDICSCSNRKDLTRLLGPFRENAERWREYSVITEAERLPPDAIRFFSIVGTDDFFLESNRKLHRVLTERKIAHEYTEVRGETEELSRHSRLFAYRALERMLVRFAELFSSRRDTEAQRMGGVTSPLPSPDNFRKDQ